MLYELICKTADPTYRFTLQEKCELLTRAPDVFDSLPPRVPALLARVEVFKSVTRLIVGRAGIGDIVANFPARIQLMCFEPDPFKQQIGKVLVPKANWSDLDISTHAFNVYDVGEPDPGHVLLCRPPVGASLPSLSRLGPLQYTGHQVALRHMEAIRRQAPAWMKTYFLVPYSLIQSPASLRKFTRETRWRLEIVAVIEDFALVSIEGI